MKIDPNRKMTSLLVPVFALRHERDFGIGDTLAVRRAIDFCAEESFDILQILPIHETVGDHSPYNPISSCSLGPSLLSLSEDDVPGFIDPDHLEKMAPSAWIGQLRTGSVKYNSVYPLKLHVLLASHLEFKKKYGAESDLAREFERFRHENESWLPAYTLFRILIWHYEGNSDWREWRPEHQAPATAESWLSRVPERPRLEEIREGLAYIQWVADRQWLSVRAHAEKRRVYLMGEMSFGVSRASADVWAHRELFDLDWNMGAQSLGAFDTSKDAARLGQNWGLPAYRWENHRADHFQWLRRRVAIERRYFHFCRVDHLRGYFRAYMFPWKGGAQHTEFSQLTMEEIAERTGGRMPRFVPGPDSDPATAKMNELQGREIISVIQDAAGDMGLIAELMNDMTDYMRHTIEDLHLADLSLPILDRNPDGSLRPIKSLRSLSMVTYGTHDHAPLAVYYRTLFARAKTADGSAATDIKNILKLIGWKKPAPETLTDELLAAFQETLLKAPCILASILVSDALGDAQRFNLPGSYGPGTWSERLEMPLHDYLGHAVYGPRLATLKKLLNDSRASAEPASKKSRSIKPKKALEAVSPG